MLFMVHRHFCDWCFEKNTKYLKKELLCVKIKMQILKKA